MSSPCSGQGPWCPVCGGRGGGAGGVVGVVVVKDWNMEGGLGCVSRLGGMVGENCRVCFCVHA